MIRQEEVTTYTCDDCGARQVPPPDEEPIGFVIHRVQHVTASHGNFAAGVFACSVPCLPGAITKSLAAAWDGTRPESAVG